MAALKITTAENDTVQVHVNVARTANKLIYCKTARQALTIAHVNLHAHKCCARLLL